MRFEVGRKRIGLAAGNFFLVLCAVTVGLIVIAAALISSQGTGSLPANSNSVNSSSSLGSSSVSSGSSFIQSAVQNSSVSSLNQSAAQYPLVWGPNPPSACEGVGGFCIEVTLGFLGQTATTNNTSTTSATTIIQGNATTIISGSITTIIRSNGTTVGTCVCLAGTSIVDLSAYVQDAVTGQNATRPDGEGPVLANSCNLQPTGFTQCAVYAPFELSVPSGDPYKVTLFVTRQYEPWSLQPAGSLCASQLLAPPVTFII